MGVVTSTGMENGGNKRPIAGRRNKHWFMWIRQFKTTTIIITDLRLKKYNINRKVPTSRKVGFPSKKTAFFRLIGGSNCKKDETNAIKYVKHKACVRLLA